MGVELKNDSLGQRKPKPHKCNVSNIVEDFDF